MKALLCKFCKSSDIEMIVKVIHNQKSIFNSKSGIKAFDWAIEHFKTPCILRYVYVCNNCKSEDHKLDKFIRE